MADETAGITAPWCASPDCQRAGSIKSERWGAYLCPTHALIGPREVVDLRLPPAGGDDR